MSKKKQLSEQVLVITGASSGIGRATAKMAAARNARVVLVARSGDELERVVREIEEAGGSAASFVGDVSKPEDMLAAAHFAVERYGRIDTWVNNAGISVYGKLRDIPLEDQRRVFDVTFWGIVYGTMAALPHLGRSRGTLINIGSEVSSMPGPLQGPYTAAKHAVAGWTDVLRIELEREQMPIAVTLIRPAGIDTPYFKHAKNLTEHEPTPPPPVYAPELVAEAILHCAVNPKRDMTVGGGAKAMIGLHQRAPRLDDKLQKRMMFKAQQSASPPQRARSGSLYEPAGPFAVSGGYGGRRRSLYTGLRLHPWASLFGFAAIGAAVAAASERPAKESF